MHIHILCCFYYYYLHRSIINSGANTNGNNLAESIDVGSNGAVFKNSIHIYTYLYNIISSPPIYSGANFIITARLIKQENILFFSFNFLYTFARFYTYDFDV